MDSNDVTQLCKDAAQYVYQPVPSDAAYITEKTYTEFSLVEEPDSRPKIKAIECFTNFVIGRDTDFKFYYLAKANAARTYFLLINKQDAAPKVMPHNTLVLINKIILNK